MLPEALGPDRKFGRARGKVARPALRLAGARSGLGRSSDDGEWRALQDSNLRPPSSQATLDRGRSQQTPENRGLL